MYTVYRHDIHIIDSVGVNISRQPPVLDINVFGIMCLIGKKGIDLYTMKINNTGNTLCE